ncbi:hypothetical protein SD37_33895 [Amycolatopsis orientalis]|uniref:FAD/NAD(P)-binding domain-containing protein n=1 Tax=Amycolatopsis orientalis TaxID=31958 RepID=A0A193C702_AMYOR|nr:hypothetical protein SD37_33895 [Amycolatopsis orientalis]
MLAAGSRPVAPDVPGLVEAGFHTSDTVLRMESLPRTMIILGGGFVAAEPAHVFSSFGVDVTVVARSGTLLRHEDADVAQRFTELASTTAKPLRRRRSWSPPTTGSCHTRYSPRRRSRRSA